MLFCDRVHPEHWVNCMMQHPPPHIWTCPHDRSLQLLYLHNNNASLLLQTEIENISWTPPSSIFLCPNYSSDASRQGPDMGLHFTGCPAQSGRHEPPLSALEAGIVTVAVSSSIFHASMGNSCEQGAEPLDMVGGESHDLSHGEDRGTDGLSAPVMVVSEPEQGLSSMDVVDMSSSGELTTLLTLSLAILLSSFCACGM